MPLRRLSSAIAKVSALAVALLLPLLLLAALPERAPVGGEILQGARQSTAPIASQSPLKPRAIRPAGAIDIASARLQTTGRDDGTEKRDAPKATAAPDLADVASHSQQSSPPGHGCGVRQRQVTRAHLPRGPPSIL